MNIFHRLGDAFSCLSAWAGAVWDAARGKTPKPPTFEELIMSTVADLNASIQKTADLSAKLSTYIGELKAADQTPAITTAVTALDSANAQLEALVPPAVPVQPQQ